MRGKQIFLETKFNNENIFEVGLDEAGRGALAGPVTVAGCIMPEGFQHKLIKDSKLLNEAQKKEARKIILEHAIAYHVEHVSAKKIEIMNILKATLNGMETCLQEIYKKNAFDHILVDGNQFHGFNDIPYTTIVGGDNKYTSIAAASILAKTERDILMKYLDEEIPGYGWNSNKGYGTKAHTNAIKEFGASEEHRMSFISHLLTETKQLF